MNRHAVNPHIFNGADAVWTFGVLEKRGPAVSRGIHIDGVIPASAYDVFDHDVPDRRADAQHADRGVAVLRGNVPEMKIFDRSADHIVIFEADHGVVRIQGDQIVIGLLADRADVFNEPVANLAPQNASRPD